MFYVKRLYKSWLELVSAQIQLTPPVPAWYFHKTHVKNPHCSNLCKDIQIAPVEFFLSTLRMKTNILGSVCRHAYLLCRWRNQWFEKVGGVDIILVNTVEVKEIYLSILHQFSFITNGKVPSTFGHIYLSRVYDWDTRCKVPVIENCTRFTKKPDLEYFPSKDDAGQYISFITLRVSDYI